MSQSEKRVTINGQPTTVDTDTQALLIDTLRDRGLFSVREACGIGICGSCTVQVDDEAVSSCLMLTEQAQGRAVRTSEGLVGPDGSLDEVQAAFVRHQAYQCSFCIPGMVMTVRALLDRGLPLTVEAVREELGGNLCRCGTYPWILQAVAELVQRGNDARRADQQ